MLMVDCWPELSAAPSATRSLPSSWVYSRAAPWAEVTPAIRSSTASSSTDVRPSLMAAKVWDAVPLRDLFSGSRVISKRRCFRSNSRSRGQWGRSPGRANTPRSRSKYDP